MAGSPFELALHPAFERDLQSLATAAARNPTGESRRLLTVTLSALAAIRDGEIPVRPLERMGSYPDLSDCNKVYIQTDPDSKPKYRLVWRERPADEAGGTPIREVIQLGERELGSVYHLTGQRLGRPSGVSLDELLRADRDTIATKLLNLPNDRFSASPKKSPEFGD